jgi:dolichyl-phosphate-mannose--protein O-mannosyl transferase
VTTPEIQARAEVPAFTLPRVNARVNAYQVALVVVLLAAFLTRFLRLGEPGQFYFDETYFPRTGQEIYRGDNKAWEFYGHENTHPPLSKLLMAGSMGLFDGLNEIVPALTPGTGGVDNPWAWRFPGALAGVGAVLFMYLLARRLFNSEIAGLAGASLLTFEGLAFAQSRIATPDAFVLFFMLGAIYFLTTQRFLLSGAFFGAAVACKWIAGLAGIPIVLFMVWLLITRLKATSWTTPIRWFEIALPAGLALIYLGAILLLYSYLDTHPDLNHSVTKGWFERGALVVLVIGVVSTALALYGLVSERISNGSFTFSPQGKVCLETALVFGVFFMLVPGFVYFMTYWPMLLDPPSATAMGETEWHGLGQVIRQNRLAHDFHSTLSADHPWASTWDEWPVMGRPIYLYTGPENTKIYSMGNPLIFWATIPALAFALWQAFAYVRASIAENGRFIVRGSLPPLQAALLFVVLSFIGFWLPMTQASRVLFLYHYLPALAFGILALAYSLDWIWRRPEWGKYAVISFLVLVALVFAFFYPHLAAVNVPDWLDRMYYPFDRGHLLDNPLLDWE